VRAFNLLLPTDMMHTAAARLIEQLNHDPALASAFAEADGDLAAMVAAAAACGHEVGADALAQAIAEALAAAGMRPAVTAHPAVYIA
jgi:hypothetical protein